jgi:hypothetical protein
MLGAQINTKLTLSVQPKQKEHRMNTNRNRNKWTLVTLVVALASLTTMGFTTANGGNHSMGIAADASTCERIEMSYPAIEMLEFIDDPCYAVLLDTIESEIDLNQSGRLSTEVLQDLSNELSRFGTFGTQEYLELIEAETDSFARPSTGFSGSGSRGEWAVGEADVTEMELDGGFGSASSTRALLDSILARSRATNSWPVDLLELSETERAAYETGKGTSGPITYWPVKMYEPGTIEVSHVAVASARRVNVEWFANFSDLIEPETDPVEFYPTPTVFARSGDKPNR